MKGLKLVRSACVARPAQALSKKFQGEIRNVRGAGAPGTRAVLPSTSTSRLVKNGQC